MDSKNRQQTLTYINKLIKQLSTLYGDAYYDVLRLTEIKNAIAAGENFTWKGNPAAEQKLNAILKSLSSKTQKIIYNGIAGSWKLGEDAVPAEILKKFGKENFKSEVHATLEQAVKDHREKGTTAHQFATQKRNGLTLSDRVWNITGNVKNEMEIIIQNGISEGKNADEIANQLKQYLNKPDKLFRRVKVVKTDKDGNTREYFVLSKAAKDYHPGTGVYRSSYKNALRLAITEVNRAYRRAEWESYQTNPLIKGYRIVLSNNHTTINPKTGMEEPFHDICDDLQGEYPKAFLWEGWHPHCRCKMIPVTLTREEMKERMIARRDGKLDEWKPKDEIKNLPQKLSEWSEKNRERIANAEKKQTLPFWIHDNKDLINIKTTPINHISSNLPAQLTPKSIYLNGEDYLFNRDFFDLLDKNKPVSLTVKKSGGSYFQSSKVAWDDKVVLDSKDRRDASPWFNKALVYHEYGHAIDQQRYLYVTPKVDLLFNKHRAYLAEKTGVQNTYRVTIVDKTLSKLYSRIQKMDDKVFQKLFGDSYGKKWDLLEQILSTRDTIKSLHPNYGNGHTDKYFKYIENRKKEYLAHAFENAFTGNKIFERYLPDIYKDLVNYINTLD
jgi:hypothetical protein